MTLLSKIIFSGGKELAMKGLFDASEMHSFTWLALGYSSTNNGFEDSQDPGATGNRFEEIQSDTYTRIPLTFKSTDIDEDTGKVTVYFQADLDYQNIATTQNINQLAVVDNGQPNSANTKFDSATMFPTFSKTSQNAMTFVIGFRF